MGVHGQALTTATPTGPEGVPLEVKNPLRLEYRRVFAGMTVSDANQLSLKV